eukprot:gnl/Ergobibamus_cyprinoides/1427.p1 GENE.gnl/Ergobibamus_cyprinoides/1427~~gnl/Ergobibamus_cyprinoides/1427.p1  ORF type:complete len:252 (-),score=75.32 gnl/Ergobibamus_cyprinoides/1427:21-776(-)
MRLTEFAVPVTMLALTGGRFLTGRRSNEKIARLIASAASPALQATFGDEVSIPSIIRTTYADFAISASRPAGSTDAKRSVSVTAKLASRQELMGFVADFFMPSPEQIVVDIPLEPSAMRATPHHFAVSSQRFLATLRTTAWDTMHMTQHFGSLETVVPAMAGTCRAATVSHVFADVPAATVASRYLSHPVIAQLFLQDCDGTPFADHIDLIHLTDFSPFTGPAVILNPFVEDFPPCLPTPHNARNAPIPEP